MADEMDDTEAVNINVQQYEDFTDGSYMEYWDPAYGQSPFVITSNQIVATGLVGSMNAYLKKDFNQTVFQDFKLSYEVNIPYIDLYAWGSLCLLAANPLTINSDTASANLDGIGTFMNHSGTLSWWYTIKDYAGAHTKGWNPWLVNTWYYSEIYREGTTMTHDIYDYDTMNLIQHGQNTCSTDPYRYLILNANKGSGSPAVDVSFRNLIIHRFMTQ